MVVPSRVPEIFYPLDMGTLDTDAKYISLHSFKRPEFNKQVIWGCSVPITEFQVMEHLVSGEVHHILFGVTEHSSSAQVVSFLYCGIMGHWILLSSQKI